PVATEPITPAEIHAAELAALRDEVDQQRTRAEAAEAELREAREVADDSGKRIVAALRQVWEVRMVLAFLNPKPWSDSERRRLLGIAADAVG
ncbi:hypothetical protein IAI36_11500, partial [Streptococcus pseudopneumoniae]|uniref:hypothetical protein n=1 Tax=Streptococcus pseudopneumoniae TaxID=257758 RepID=UPI0018B01E0F